MGDKMSDRTTAVLVTFLLFLPAVVIPATIAWL